MKTLLTLALLFTLNGCIPLMPGQSIDDQIKAQEANNLMGCSFILGGGNPPASRVDGGHIGCYGDGMTPEIGQKFMETLKGMK